RLPTLQPRQVPGAPVQHRLRGMIEVENTLLPLRLSLLLVLIVFPATPANGKEYVECRYRDDYHSCRHRHIEVYCQPRHTDHNACRCQRTIVRLCLYREVKDAF